MKLIQLSDGMIMAFGFDMSLRLPSNMICWCDPNTFSWEPKVDNQAGRVTWNTIKIDPQFITELPNGKLLVYQPGVMIEMMRVGTPMIWHAHLTRSMD